MERKKVIGVSYDLGAAAPAVMLKAAGDAADAVLDAARDRQDLPVVRDAALVDQLYRLPLDSAIGKELFPVMAVLLAHVLRLDRKTKEESV